MFLLALTVSCCVPVNQGAHDRLSDMPVCQNAMNFMCVLASVQQHHWLVYLYGVIEQTIYFWGRGTGCVPYYFYSGFSEWFAYFSVNISDTTVNTTMLLSSFTVMHLYSSHWSTHNEKYVQSQFIVSNDWMMEYGKLDLSFQPINQQHLYSCFLSL